MDLFERIKSWTELFYYISGSLLLLISVYAAQQVRIMELDIRLRGERAAKEKAIEYALKYLSVFIPLDSKFAEEVEKKKLPAGYKGETGNFEWNELTAQDQAAAIKRAECFQWLTAMNELLAISAAYVSGVADESTGFEIIGRSYCHTIKWNYDIICLCRNDIAYPYWESIVTLYRIWAPRLRKAELIAKRDSLDRVVSTIEEQELGHPNK